MSTQLRFFCQGTPIYVYIDLKRSLSNLILSQGKLNLWPMSKTSKLCQVVIIRLVMIGQVCLYYFAVTLDQKAIATNQTNASIEKVISNIWWKIVHVIFWLAIFQSSTRRRRKPMAYLESWGNSEQEKCTIYVKKIDLKIWPFWPDHYLISIKSQVVWRHRVKWLSPSISACKMTQKTSVARLVCDFYFIVTFCLWPDLDLL